MANHVKGVQPAVLHGESMPFPSHFASNIFISGSHKRCGVLVKASGLCSLVFKEANGRFLEWYRMLKRFFLNPLFISKENHTNVECFL